MDKQSKCLFLSVFTNDFDHFTIPAVFHWANFVPVKFLSNYRHSFQSKIQDKRVFFVLITLRIGDRIVHLLNKMHSWAK